jgi:histidinol-phosphate aminotransferase
MMSAQLTALGFRVAPSCANFLFLTAGSLRQNWRSVCCAMASLSSHGGRRYEHWIRVSVGNEQDNQQFIRSLKRILAEDAA